MSTKPGKAAIVTGASRGIGKDIALRLAADGFAVAIGYAGNQPQADAVVAEIQAKGGTAIAVKGNVADADDVTRLFSSAQQAFGRLDAVVSNAGIMDLAPIKTDNVAALDRMMTTNVRGTFLVLAKAAEVLGNGGRIVALSTSVIAKATPGYGPYVASKSAVEGLVHVLANELRGRNITVNAVAPVNRTGNRGGCLVKVKQVPQRVLQVADSTFLRLLPAGCLRSIPAGVGG